MLLAENAKYIVNTSQPHERLGVKRSDSPALNKFHVYVGNDWKAARAY